MEFFKNFRNKNKPNQENKTPTPPPKNNSWWTRGKLTTALALGMAASSSLSAQEVRPAEKTAQEEQAKSQEVKDVYIEKKFKNGITEIYKNGKLTQRSNKLIQETFDNDGNIQIKHIFEKVSGEDYYDLTRSYFYYRGKLDSIIINSSLRYQMEDNKVVEVRNITERKNIPINEAPTPPMPPADLPKGEGEITEEKKEESLIHIKENMPEAPKQEIEKKESEPEKIVTEENKYEDKQNNRTIIELPGGVKQYIYSDGTTIVESPDGKKIEVPKDDRATAARRKVLALMEENEKLNIKDEEQSIAEETRRSPRQYIGRARVGIEVPVGVEYKAGIETKVEIEAKVGTGEKYKSYSEFTSPYFSYSDALPLPPELNPYKLSREEMRKVWEIHIENLKKLLPNPAVWHNIKDQQAYPFTQVKEEQVHKDLQPFFKYLKKLQEINESSVKQKVTLELPGGRAEPKKATVVNKGETVEAFILRSLQKIVKDKKTAEIEIK